MLTRQVRLRLTEADVTTLQHLAEVNGKTFSEYIRTVLAAHLSISK